MTQKNQHVDKRLYTGEEPRNESHTLCKSHRLANVLVQGYLDSGGGGGGGDCVSGEGGRGGGSGGLSDEPLGMGGKGVAMTLE